MEIFKKKLTYFKSRLINFIILFLISAFLFSCSLISGSGNQAAKINFFNSSSFDFKLSLCMKSSEPVVIIHFVSPVDINNIPVRLDKWLCMLEEFGGKIELEAEETESKGLVNELVSLAVGTYDMTKEKKTYDPVKKYNTKIYYNAQTGMISRVVFKLKPENEDAQ